MKRTVAALSMCCVALFSMLLYEALSSPSVPASGALTAEDQQERRPLYIVRVTDGVLAVYPYGSDTAEEVTDIRLSSLRDYDQQLMLRGFPLYSEEELSSFLEDFGS